MNLAVTVDDPLRLMFHRGNGEMLRQDGERIHQQFILTVDDLLHLLLRTILLTEETRAFLNGLSVNLRTCRHHTGWIPLYLYRVSPYRQFTGLDATHILITAAHLVPLLQLTIEEPLEG